jgi:hypothetical protein
MHLVLVFFADFRWQQQTCQVTGFAAGEISPYAATGAAASTYCHSSAHSFFSGRALKSWPSPTALPQSPSRRFRPAPPDAGRPVGPGVSAYSGRIPTVARCSFWLLDSVLAFL